MSVFNCKRKMFVKRPKFYTGVFNRGLWRFLLVFQAGRYFEIRMKQRFASKECSTLWIVCVCFSVFKLPRRVYNRIYSEMASRYVIANRRWCFFRLNSTLIRNNRFFFVCFKKHATVISESFPLDNFLCWMLLFLWLLKFMQVLRKNWRGLFLLFVFT